MKFTSVPPQFRLRMPSAPSAQHRKDRLELLEQICVYEPLTYRAEGPLVGLAILGGALLQLPSALDSSLFLSMEFLHSPLNFLGG